jgi:hypothetical protein
VCRTSDGGAAKFTQASIDRYQLSEARAFAANQRVSPVGASPDDTIPSDTAPSTAGGGGSSSDDDDGDDEWDVPPVPDPGTDPPEEDDSGFCATHSCIPNYPNGRGSTVQCADGSYSHSGGIQGACSHHGGVG